MRAPVLLAILSLVEARLLDPAWSATHYRESRQTVVSSEANASGDADVVDTDAMAHHYKTVDGVVGMNVSSGGTAAGANSASIDNSGKGTVGGTSIDATGNVASAGNNANSVSDIFAQIYGDKEVVNSYQQGKGEGVGETLAGATGGATMTKNGEKGQYSSDKTIATAGATGSLGSSSEVIASQKLTWESILADLVGSAVAEGIGNAQANVDLGAGNAMNGVEVNGVVSGVNSGEGNVNAQVNGNAHMNNSQHELVGNMYGKVNGSGDSQLVGASALQSNTSGLNSTINMFGDSKIHGGEGGTSGIDLQSQSNLTNTIGANGDIIMNGTANSANKNMTVQNGIQVQDGNGGTLAIGHGAIHGNGTENSNASIIVDTKYNQNGEAQVVAKGVGEAVSQDKDSGLSIGANADLTNSNGVNNAGQATGSGIASGKESNITGVSFVNVDGAGSNGNAMMEAWGGGEGPSHAGTNTGLVLQDGNNEVRNMTVNGSVSADGDKTSVHSISVVTDYAGEQTLSNYQKATSQSKGSGSSSASNSAVIMKRKKRSNLGVLFDKLF